jgi:DNA-binding CsgD family transcriptional regulator
LSTLSSIDYQNIQKFVSEVAASGEFFQEGVLDSLQKVFGYQHAIFWRLDHYGNLNEPTSMNIDEQILDLYIRNFREEDILSPHKISSILPRGNVIRIIDVTTKRSYEQSNYYQFFMKTFGFYHELGVYLLDGIKIIGVIGLVRPQSEEGFNMKDVQQLKLLSQYLSQILSHRLQLEKLKGQKQLLESLIHYSDMGVILFDPSFRIHYANPLAEQIAVEFLSFNKNKQLFDDPIKHFIIQIVSRTLWKLGLKKTISFECNQSFSVEILPTGNTSEHHKGYVAYIKRHLVSSHKISANEVHESVLTTKEKEVVKLVSQGYANHEIAAQMFVSVNTIKKHLQNIYKKLGVNNRTSLSYLSRNKN